MEEESLEIPKKFQIGCYDEFDPVSLNLLDLHHSSVERQKGLQKISDRNEEESDNKTKNMRKSAGFFDIKFYREIRGKLPVDRLVSQKTRDINSGSYGKNKVDLGKLTESLDNISHWICKLSNIQSNNVAWFINNESVFYIARLISEFENFGKEILVKKLIGVLQVFYKENGYYLKFVNRANSEVQLDDNSMAKIVVPFEDAISMLKSHRAELIGGFVYVQADWKSISYLIEGLFKRNLWNEVRRIEETFKIDEIEDSRLKTLISNLPDMVISQDLKVDFSSSATLKDSRITPDIITSLSKNYFPLCMSEMHHHLRTKKVLKHFGRLQYGLFLKSAGVSVKDSRNFFKSFFSQKGITASKLNEYMYYIDHMYGLKGKKTDYSAWACKKVISKTPNSGDVFGCPFAYYGKAQLKTAIRRQIGDERKVNDVIDEWDSTTGSSKNIKGACQKHFQVRYGRFVETIGIHPNLYFRKAFERNEEQQGNFDKKSGKENVNWGKGKSSKKMNIEYEKDKGGKSNVSNLT